MQELGPILYLEKSYCS